MKCSFGTVRPPSAVLAALIALCAQNVPAQTDPSIQSELRQLKEHLKQQQAIIDELNRKVGEIETRQSQTPAVAKPAPKKSWLTTELGKLHIGGEGGIAFFNTGSEGAFPNKEFRIDEAKLFIEAPIWTDIYVVGEVNILTREEPDTYFRIGELFLDFENLGRWFNRDRWLNLRVGRLDVPFGEEYLTRDAIDNPLISHSLSDIWGVDEGIELYGTVGKFNYLFAVQNGGHPSLRDYNGDKAIVGRLSFDPEKWLHLSVSGMRTGDLDVNGDQFSELWFGSAFIRALGNPATTTTFHAELFEGDVQFNFPRGYLRGAGGYMHSNDNDTSDADNERDVYYYYTEGVFNITPKIYAAARFSQIFAGSGFPLLGASGNWFNYFMTELTTELSRLSVGIGYRPVPNLLLKTDFTYNTGETVSGESRNHENLFAVEAAFKF
ncbi:MAG TPA: hypothetical protein VK850_01015 [Candidatus Binatia bacterium]|nr:hypothetical protein [Candidatus Binatia bacterium]